MYCLFTVKYPKLVEKKYKKIQMDKNAIAICLLFNKKI